MTEPDRSAPVRTAPLESSDVFKTQAERRAELRPDADDRHAAARPDGGDLSRLAPPRAGGLAWAPYLSAFAEAGMVGACADWFAVVALFRPLRLPIPHRAVVPENKRRVSAAMGVSSPTFFPPAWPSHACHPSTLSVLRRDGSRTSATRERSRPPPDAPFRMRSTLCRKRRSTNRSPLPRGAGSRPFPPRPLASRGLSILSA